MKKADINEITARIKTEPIPFRMFVAWVDGEEEERPTAIGNTPQAAKAALVREIKERIEMEED